MKLASAEAVEWRVTPGLTPYEDALAEMEARVAAIRAGTAPQLVWLLEHPPLYTAGTSAAPEELLATGRFPVFKSGRGGRYTYHGPGQRVGYVLLDLDERRDVRHYVHSLEAWLVEALAEFGISARTVPDRVGIWVDDHGREAKVGAIGVRVRRWVTLHGFAVNLDPDLSHFTGIVPCGLAEYPVTSLTALGVPHSSNTFDAALKRAFPPFIDRLNAGAERS